MQSAVFAQAGAELSWLLTVLRLNPVFAEALAPWEAVLESLHPPLLWPAATTLELGVWLAALVGFPENLRQQLLRAGLAESDYAHHAAAAQAALARDPEPALEWLLRALSHLPAWLASGMTPFAAYYSLRRLHFLSRGRSSALISMCHQALRPVLSLPLPPHLLGLPETQLAVLTATLEQDSAVLLPARLPVSLISGLRNFAQQTPCRPSLAGVEHRDPVTGASLLPRLRFDPGRPRAHRYDFDQADLWSCTAVQQLAADPLWPWLASRYLGCDAVLTQAYLWWSVAYNGPQSRYTGQVYHVDLDRFHFVNFFFYLSDVGPDNGPQRYVRGSHREMPLVWAQDRRWADADVRASDLMTLTGPAGTVIWADTRALHKGQTLKQGTRLMFQMEFACSTLGENVPQVPLPKSISPPLQKALQAFPRRYPLLRTWLR